ncbi:MAG: L,D-transpeptidase family protein [Acidimicrobiia bacterium]
MRGSGQRRAAGGWRAALAVALAGTLLGGCATGGGEEAQLSARPAGIDLAVGDVAAAVPEDGPTGTTTTVPAAAAEAAPLPGLAVGAEGPVVQKLEQKLEALKYFVGSIDGKYDADTRDAVLAFQKVTGMERTGRATDDVVAAVEAATGVPEPLVGAGGYRRVEVDLDRQVLFLYEGNKLDVILGVSTGSNQRFCSEGWCRRAVTPTGAFTVYEKRTGWEKSPLGWLYNSQYFNGGIAFHGSRSVPAHPASHGCVRLQMSAAEWFPDRITVGTPVYVVAADEPRPTPVGLTPTTMPTTVPSAVAETPATSAPAPTTTVPNLLSQLLGPATTVKP